MTDCSHFLDFHRPGDSRAGTNAGPFLASALARGGVAIAIAGARTAKGIFAQLARTGHDPVAAMNAGRFTLYESAEMLSRFTSRRGISADEFDRSVGAKMRELKALAGGAPVHAFGDMVGVLWQRDKREQAVELERLWQQLQHEVGFALYCAYPVDVFGEDFNAGALAGVLETHTHISPIPGSTQLGRAFDRAMDEVLRERASEIRSLAVRPQPGWPAMPKLEKMILWLRTHQPDAAQAVLKRARQYYQDFTPRLYLREEHSRF